jgi:AraC-like DNA-binding protein
VTFELLFWVALARIGLRAEVRPTRVVSPVPPPPSSEYRDYLGVDITWGERPAVAFAAHDAARRFVTADEDMWAFFEPELARRLAALERDAGTAQRVRSALVEQLPAGRASMKEVARHLAMSSRTLQRRLQDEETTFQRVLAQTRESLARHYLTRSELPASEIALLLGYDDTNSFYRAFSGWTGRTPQTMRLEASH